jgi:hypothetical protein
MIVIIHIHLTPNTQQTKPGPSEFLAGWQRELRYKWPRRMRVTFRAVVLKDNCVHGVCQIYLHLFY